MKKKFLSMLLAFAVVAAPLTVFAATSETIVAGLVWTHDSYVASNLARVVNSRLDGYNFRKWVRAKCGNSDKNSGWIERNEAMAFVEVYGSFWDTGYTYYDYQK